MKRIFKFTLMVILLMGTAMPISAGTWTKTIILCKTPVNTGGIEHEEEETGERRPGKPFTCTFDSENGIEFIGQETPEFSLYEIYVTETECIYASGDEFDFIEQLFTLTGSYQICLTTTDGCVYAGYVQL